MKKQYLGSTIGVAIIALAVGALFALGYIYFGIKVPGQKVSVSYRVCSSEVVDQYSKINADSAQEERQSLTDVTTRIKAIGHNEADPTCQTMLFLAAFRTEDYQGMRQPMQLIQSMYDRGIYADSNLQSGYSVKMMNSLLKEVISDTKKS
ncbi:hypothetical protein H7Y29_03335 [Microbacteriaceae bacterium]|nr:hypothetical protein [Candidatus Saccharibacteria bacterium]